MKVRPLILLLAYLYCTEGERIATWSLEDLRADHCIPYGHIYSGTLFALLLGSRRSRIKHLTGTCWIWTALAFERWLTCSMCTKTRSSRTFTLGDDLSRRARKRLTGTQPYSSNKGSSPHYAEACNLLGTAVACDIIVCCQHAKDVYEEKFGELEEPISVVTIEGRERNVLHLDHPEHSASFVNKARLESTMAHLNAFRNVSCIQSSELSM